MSFCRVSLLCHSAECLRIEECHSANLSFQNAILPSVLAYISKHPSFHKIGNSYTFRRCLWIPLHAWEHFLRWSFWLSPRKSVCRRRSVVATEKPHFSSGIIIKRNTKKVMEMQWWETNQSNFRIYPTNIHLLPPHGTTLTAFADVKYGCSRILHGLVSSHPWIWSIFQWESKKKETVKIILLILLF